MSGIIRSDIDREFACSGIVEAGDFVFLSFCVGNVGAAFEEQVNGASGIFHLWRKYLKNGLLTDIPQEKPFLRNLHMWAV